ncbi:hypothetical protein ACTID9_19010 [Brevibacillus fluminis]|uniref:hypothetical protein n=1 Tax=Brevibacillus fluminis TaxID=511487 RepID=UPI003F8B28B8
MVTLDSSISFLIYITAVSSAAAGITEAVKSVVPFLSVDYEPHDDEKQEDHHLAGRLTNYKKFTNLSVSVCSASVIFALLGLDPAKILTQSGSAAVDSPWSLDIMAWGIVAVFGSPFFHSILKILEGLRMNMDNNTFTPKPVQKVSSTKK